MIYYEYGPAEVDGEEIKKFVKRLNFADGDNLQISENIEDDTEQ